MQDSLVESKKGKLIKTESKIVVTKGWDGGIGEMVFRDANLQRVDSKS